MLEPETIALMPFFLVAMNVRAHLDRSRGPVDKLDQSPLVNLVTGAESVREDQL
jgi:hypothetical protein